MQTFRKSEQGTAMVEATLMLPFCMIMIVGVLYAALYLCQKANIQSNLETALLYYKAAESDTYVESKTQMEYDGSGLEAVGSNYWDIAELKYLEPYSRLLSTEFKEDNFKKFVRDICGHMFFDTGENIHISAVSGGNPFYRTISATAVQEIIPPINLSMVGGPDTMVIQVTGEIVVTDGDDFIRNMDFAIDVLVDTKLGEIAQEIGDRAQEIYGKFKEALHVGG